MRAKKVLTALLITLAMSQLVGCGQKKAEVTTLSVSSKGVITLQEVDENMSSDYYDEDELKKYVEKIASNVDGCSVRDVSLKKGTAYVKSVYQDTKAYKSATGYDFYKGTILSARAAGYDFTTGMTKVTDGVLSEEDVLGTTLPSDSKCIIVEQFGIIDVPGVVTYISNTNAVMSGDDVLVIEPEDESKVLVYIVYQ